jgi:hypothetical protein
MNCNIYKKEYFNIYILLLLIIGWGCSSGKTFPSSEDITKSIKENSIIVQNIGYKINTEFDEVAPVFSPDRKFFFFTSSRPNPSSKKSGDQDIWFSKINENGYGLPNNLGPPINSIGNQGSVAFSADGKYAYYVLPDREGGFGNYDLYFSEIIGSNWSEPKNLGKEVNFK